MKIHRFPLLLSIFLLGSVLLSACTGGGVARSWPGVSATQDMVYLADAGSLYAVNASNGTLAWRFPDKPNTAQPFYAAPALTNDLIVAGNYGHQLFGLSKDGKQKWVFDSETGNFAGSPLIVDSTVLAPSSNNWLYALDINGKLLWKFETRNALWSTPASDGQVVYLPALDHNLYALKVSDGSLVWKKDLGSALISAPLLTKDGILYLGTMEGSVVAVKVADGSVLWTAKTGGQVWGTPVLHEDLLFVGNAGNKVSAINTKDGSIAWQQDAKSPIIGGGALLPDGVAFVTEGGTLIAWPFDGSKQLWSQPVNGKLYTTPVVAGQTLIVAVTEGDKLLQAFKLDGQVAWPFVAPK